MKKISEAQKKARARTQLFRQLCGISLKRFIDTATYQNALTPYEYVILSNIITLINNLKKGWFDGSKEVGLKPRRRCAICKGIAHWEATILGDKQLLCNKHKKEFQKDMEDPRFSDKYKDNYSFKKINPYD